MYIFFVNCAVRLTSAPLSNHRSLTQKLIVFFFPRIIRQAHYKFHKFARKKNIFPYFPSFPFFLVKFLYLVGRFVSKRNDYFPCRTANQAPFFACSDVQIVFMNFIPIVLRNKFFNFVDYSPLYYCLEI